MPGPIRSQGVRRPAQSRVGQPRDQDGRPQSGAERRGGRTYKPGLHDWSPGAAGRPGERGADASVDRGQPARPVRPVRPVGDEIRTPFRPARPPFGRQGAQGPRTGSENGSGFPRSPMRPGSMGNAPANGGSAPASGGSVSANRGRAPVNSTGNRPVGLPRRDDQQPGPRHNDQARSGQSRQGQASTPQTGSRAGGTRFGSEEPRDNGNRSRYRSNTAQPASRPAAPGRGYRDEQGAPDGNRADRAPGSGLQPAPFRRSGFGARRAPVPGADRRFNAPGSASTRNQEPAQPGGKRPYADLDVIEGDAGRDHPFFRDVKDEVIGPGDHVKDFAATARSMPGRNRRRNSAS